jgi:hypothetical protein
MHFMQIFMAGFFLTFSFFKLLNLKGFAESYAMYDVIAKRIPVWGYIYAFIGVGFRYCLSHQLQSACYKRHNLYSNDSKHHWCFTKCVKQKENSVRLFGCSFQFTQANRQCDVSMPYEMRRRKNV